MPCDRKHPAGGSSNPSSAETTDLNLLLNSRRSFLRTAAVLAAGGASTLSASARRKGSKSNSSSRGRSSSSSRSSRGLYKIRRNSAKSIRFRAAHEQAKAPDPENRPNSDETALDGFIGNFSKGLPHDSSGEVDPAAYQSLLAALPGRNASAWEAIPLGGDRKLANPQASLAYSLTGADSHATSMPPAPAFASAEEASEMAECYLHAILRDVPFDSYAGNVDASWAAAQLNGFSNFTGPKVGGNVTPQTLFRGSFDGDLAGNYVSQFLLLDVPQGAGRFPQHYQTTVPGDDFMLNLGDWLSVQRGEGPAVGNTYEADPKYITTARDLGEYVHRDHPYQTYLQAALILLGLGAPLNPNNPYNASGNQGGFVTFGAAEILCVVAEAAQNALKAAWYHKWQVHRRLRPETFAGRLHLTKTGAKSYPVNEEILNSDVVDEIAARFGGGYWLPMAYPEGSPTHPAYPAGHAAIAGACTTILKALFDESAVIEDGFEVDPASNGASLRNYTGSDTLTVGGELNKLANNIAIGRNLAGVHWRTDGTEGIFLGEQVAVSMLRDSKLTFPEDYEAYSFTGFRGDTITI